MSIFDSMKRGKVITRKEADRLHEEGASIIVDLPSSLFGGYFGGKPGNPNLVAITDEGCWLLSAEDLETSEDGCFIRFVEEGDGSPLLSFEDAFIELGPEDLLLERA